MLSYDHDNCRTRNITFISIDLLILPWNSLLSGIIFIWAGLTVARPEVFIQPKAPPTTGRGERPQCTLCCSVGRTKKFLRFVLLCFCSQAAVFGRYQKLVHHTNSEPAFSVLLSFMNLAEIISQTPTTDQGPLILAWVILDGTKIHDKQFPFLPND